nr:protein doublesex [Hodotermopsis sjostedti]
MTTRILELQCLSMSVFVSKMDRKSRSHKQLRHCRRCLNHGEVNHLKGHKYYCEYRQCYCKKCCRIAEHQRKSAQQIAYRRARELDKARQTSQVGPNLDGVALVTPRTTQRESPAVVAPRTSFFSIERPFFTRDRFVATPWMHNPTQPNFTAILPQENTVSTELWDAALLFHNQTNPYNHNCCCMPHPQQHPVQLFGQQHVHRAGVAVDSFGVPFSSESSASWLCAQSIGAP